MLKFKDFKDESKITIEEVEQAVDKNQLIHEIRTSKHFRAMPFKEKVIEKIQSMSDEQVRQFVKEAYPMARKEKGIK